MDLLQENHGIIGVHSPPPPPKILGLPLNLGPPLIPKLQVSPLIYVVEPLAILDPHINICVRPPHTLF